MDNFKDAPISLTSPATAAAAITPDDTNAFANISRAIYVGNTGDISAEMKDGQIVTFANVQAGTVLAIRAIRVRVTGTTASGLVALW